jgi:hypothetical protein
MAALRYFASAAVLALGISAAAPAGAQEPATAESNDAFGSKRPLVLALENLGGFAYTRVEPDEGDTSSNYQAGIFLQAPGGLGGPMGRIGLHYFVSPPVSVGLLLGYADNDLYGATWSTGARLGFAMPMSGRNALWLRGGVTYTHTRLDVLIVEVTTTHIAPGAEVLFVLEPVEGFGVMVGPMFEYGFGKQESNASSSSFGGGSQEAKFKTLQAGLTFGVLADF